MFAEERENKKAIQRWKEHCEGIREEVASDDTQDLTGEEHQQ